jgi:hypothetical protein
MFSNHATVSVSRFAEYACSVYRTVDEGADAESVGALAESVGKLNAGADGN